MADFSRLPGPNADLWDWQLLAACRGVDSSLFFHPEGERGAARTAREASAKEVCTRCPVRSECASHALTVREPYGVWGGLTEDEREELLGRARRNLVRTADRHVGESASTELDTAPAGADVGNASPADGDTEPGAGTTSGTGTVAGIGTEPGAGGVGTEGRTSVRPESEWHAA